MADGGWLMAETEGEGEIGSGGAEEPFDKAQDRHGGKGAEEPGSTSAPCYFGTLHERERGKGDGRGNMGAGEQGSRGAEVQRAGGENYS